MPSDGIGDEYALTSPGGPGSPFGPGSPLGPWAPVAPCGRADPAAPAGPVTWITELGSFPLLASRAYEDAGCPPSAFALFAVPATVAYFAFCASGTTFDSAPTAAPPAGVDPSTATASAVAERIRGNRCSMTPPHVEM